MWHSGCFLDATGKRKRAYSKGAILTCKETTRLICEYLEGRLGPGVTRDVTWHLARCKDCRLVLDAARKTLRSILVSYFNSGSDPMPRKSEVG
ncbi:MAG: hypothetical protein DMG28_10105 [Acidobacteria bacterium]|nr:MAG: hypothetical protein DMG28_10105 [Acidobacteriota bacterium]